MTFHNTGTPLSTDAIVVGVGEGRLSNRPSELLVTYALGTCLGVTAHDAQAGVGGLLHAMLPTSSINPEDSQVNPYKYVDTGVPRLLEGLFALGADPRRLVLTVAGGVWTKEREQKDSFQIGKRNMVMLRKVLWERNLLLKATEVGGEIPRGMTLLIRTGEVLVKMNGETRKLA
jgi:chemotaxis protein CheD